ncbi:MAG: permease prefix domain 2-containing transporter [Methylobacter sp.]
MKLEKKLEYYLAKEIVRINFKNEEQRREIDNRRKSINHQIIRLVRLAFVEEKSLLNKPPKAAEYLIYLLIPRKNREAMLGDLQEDFHEVCEKFGLRKAKFHYWFQVLRSIPPLIGSSVIKFIVASVTRAFKTTN